MRVMISRCALVAPGLFVLVATLAGCAERAPELEGHTAPPSGFAADVIFHETGKNGRLTLDGPVEVALPNRTQQLAYRLVETIFMPDAPYVQSWYLSEDYRLLARERACGYAAPPRLCGEYVEWSWTGLGTLNPFGIGFPALAQTGELAAPEGKDKPLVSWHADRGDDGSLRLNVRGRAENASATEVFVYREGRALPDGPRVKVVNYRQQGTLEGAAPVPQWRGPDGRPWAGILFPGEANVIGDWGLSHLDLAGAAFPELGPDSTSCIQLYELRIFSFVGRRGQGNVPLVPGESDERLGQAVVEANDAGTASAAVVGVWWNASSRTVETRLSQASVGESPFSCSDIHQSPFPSVSYDEGITFVQSLNISGNREIVRFSQALGHQMGRTPADGWHSWTFDLKPWTTEPGASQEPYQIRLEPYSELPFIRAYVRPGDLFS